MYGVRKICRMLLILKALLSWQGKCVSLARRSLMSRQQGVDSGKRARMATIDVDKLCDYMTDYFGTAVFNSFPAAILDLSDIESMSGYELCQKAESLGIDLRDFEIR